MLQQCTLLLIQCMKAFFLTTLVARWASYISGPRIRWSLCWELWCV